jgi:hypothetical protein
MIKDIQMIRLFTDFLRNDMPFTFVKMGDAELLCMNGRDGITCDKHPYSRSLQAALIEAFKILYHRPNVYVGRWQETWQELADPFGFPQHWCEFNLIIPKTTNATPEVLEFYRAIKESPLKKLFVAPAVNKTAVEMLGAKHITIPEINLWASYPLIAAMVEREDFDILLTSAGMPAKVLMADTIMKREVTMIDIGSGLDPVCGRNTRDGQLPPDEARNFFKELL